jgi:hypothetical protein
LVLPHENLIARVRTRVAFFAHLIRCEFHFATAHDIASVAGWPSRAGR